MKAWAFAAALAGALSATAPAQAGLFSTTPGTVSAADLARIHKIGIVSVLDPQIHFATIGTTVFSNSGSTVDAAGWDLNGTANKAAQSVLGARFTVSTLAPSPDLFADEHYWQWHNGNDYSKMLIDKMGNAAVDAYLLIQPHEARDDLGDTNALLYGLGVYRRNLLGSHTAYEHAFLRIALIDARTGDYLAVTAPCLDSCDGTPARRFEDTGWPDDTAALSKDQVNKLQSDFTAIVNGGLSLGLKKMFGIP